MLQQAFNMAEEASRRILETESFERSSTVRFAGFGQQHLPMRIRGKRGVQRVDTIIIIIKEGTTKVIIIKVKMITMVRRIGTKTPRVLTRRKKIRKNPKDKDVYLTLTKDVKFCCPTGFDENIFACVCRMIQEKVDSARQAGITGIKTINTVEKDNFMRVFNFPEDVYDSAWAQAQERRTLVHQETPPIDYRRATQPENYLNSGK